jgi:hypothetical protein
VQDANDSDRRISTAPASMIVNSVHASLRPEVGAPDVRITDTVWVTKLTSVTPIEATKVLCMWRPLESVYPTRIGSLAANGRFEIEKVFERASFSWLVKLPITPEVAKRSFTPSAVGDVPTVLPDDTEL